MVSINRYAAFAAAIVMIGCGDSPSQPVQQPEFTGHIYFVTASAIRELSLADSTTRTIRAVASDEIPSEVDVSPSGTELAVGALIDRAQPRVTVSRISDGAILRSFQNGTCPRYLRDGRLSYIVGSNLVIDGSTVGPLIGTPTCPEWYSNGTTALYGSGPIVYLKNLSNPGGDVQQRSDNGTTWLDFDLSPDGTTFAGARVGAVVLLHGLLETKATYNVANAFAVSWAPDGKAISFVTQVGNPGIYALRVSDGSTKQLFSGTVYTAVWGK